MGSLNYVQIGGIFLFIFLVFESLAGRKSIKLGYKAHKNLSLVLLTATLGHGLYGYSLYGFSGMNFFVGSLLFISLALGTYLGFNIRKSKLKNHKYLAYAAALFALFHALSGLGIV